MPIVRPGDSAGVARASLAGNTYDSAAHVVVCDADGTFSGILRVESLLAAPTHATAASLMDTAAPVVAPGADQEIAAWRAAQRGESALAVVDASRRFVGLIPPDRLIAVLLAEHEEDLSRLGGFAVGARAVRKTSEEPVPMRFRHRIPWLLIGLGGALAAADLVASFETALRAQLALAFFLPGIVYLADAVGTQTETLVVRALSVGVPLRRMAAREALTGLAIGAALAAAAFPLLWLRWQAVRLASGVALALFAACSTATLAAMLLPALMQRAGFDPAFGSGPLATVVQDLISIALFFAIAGVFA
ncbi:MAG TPA: magnesium transporter [Myxococcota bacterium]|nr:magnesium transporter [Myxococcota bacterium]